jgi:hypothetical protein
MNIRIVPYTAEQEEAVRAFNARLAAAHLDSDLYSTRFPESHVPAWLPKRPGCDLYQEYFVAVDEESMVRGGYILKHQPFVVKGQQMDLVGYQLPISEGIIDRRFAGVAAGLYMDARRRHGHLWALGGGRLHVPVVKFLLAAQWQATQVPFWFRVVHPHAFLRNIAFLRTSPARRILFDFFGYSGLGWLGIKALHGVHGKHRPSAAVTCETVDEFGDWADDLWNDCENDYALVAVRDRQLLNILYPATDARFIRLKVTRKGKIIGWTVLLNTPMCGHRHFGEMRVGTLVGCLARPDDACDVVACAGDVLEAGGVDLIVSNQCSRIWRRAMKDCGFLEGPSNLPFLASPELAALLQPFEQNATAFHLTRGDGDGPIHL